MKTYSRHYQLVQDMLKHIDAPHYVVFGEKTWKINGIEFKPVLHSKRYEEQKIAFLDKKIEDYRFEASVEENLKVYETAKTHIMKKQLQ